MRKSFAEFQVGLDQRFTGVDAMAVTSRTITGDGQNSSQQSLSRVSSEQQKKSLMEDKTIQIIEKLHDNKA